MPGSGSAHAAEAVTPPLDGEENWIAAVTNFFLAGMQTAFGPIAVAYLAAREWTAKDTGFVLSIGRHRQFGQSGACRASETNAGGDPLFRLWPSFSLVASRVLQGITGRVLGPAVVAISLGLVGHARLAERLGQS